MEHAPTIPATGAAFLDRIGEMARLGRVVAAVRAGSPRWLALVGQRKIGKTSLLKEWMRRTEAGGVTWAAFDLFREPPGPLFLKRWVLRVLDAALESEVGASLESASVDPGRWRALLLGSPTVRALPTDVQSWLLGVTDSPPSAAWIAPALELPEQLARATGTPMVVVIDEFQELLDGRGFLGEHELPRRLRGAWQHHAFVSYVISGSAQHTIEQLVAQKKSPFFQHFDLLRLGPLPADASAELLTRVAQRPVPADVAAAAIGVLGGHPLCLHALGDALAGGAGPVTLAEVKSAIQDTLFSSDGRLALHFEQTWREIVGHASTAVAVVALLAEAPTRLSDAARVTGLATGAIASTLTRLGEAVVKQPDGRYTLADPVLSLWVRWRAPGGTAVPMRTLGDDGERRAAEALVARGFELVYQSRGSRGAFDLLAIRNSRTLGVQVKRRALPLRLRKAELERMRADSLIMAIPWVLAVVEPEGGVWFLDPGRFAGVAASIEANIGNLPRWFDEVG